MEQSSSLEIRGSDRVFVTKAVVPRYGWEIVAGQPYDRVMAKVTRVRNIVVGLSAFLAVLGIVAAVLFAYRTAMPMGLLIGLFGAAKNTKAESISNSYDYINENIRRLIHDRDELREVVADQEPIVRTAFAEQLLSGRIRNREECAVIADRLGIAGSNLIMLPAAIALADRSRLLTERSLHELVELKTVLRRGLSASFSDEHLMFDTDETSMALVLWFDKTEKARIRERIEPMISIVATAISAHQAAEISFVFGPVCTDPFALSDSYTRAATLLLTHSSNQVILWAEDHPPAERSMYYPARIELQLKNAIQIGEGDAAEVIVRELLVENSDVRHLDPVILRILWSSVIGTIVRALDEIGYNNEAVLSWIDDSVNGKGMGSLSIGMPDIVQLVQISCAGTRNRVSDPGTKIIKQALTEIDLHLSDQNLSLQSVASALSLSEVHLSRLFSARIGRTFRDYVEEVRMARAKSLLLSTNYSIKEIAFSLGYQSLNSFSRAFHRRNGCTASSFRS